MAILNSNAIYDIYERLEYNFLYDSDLNSIHILLNLYDLDKDIKNIYLKYISRDELWKVVSNILDGCKDHHGLSKYITEKIHDDINRLELYIYLEGYRQGYFDLYLVNKLENISIRKSPLNKLYDKKYLYHFECEDEEVKRIKESLYQIILDEKKEEWINTMTVNYYFDVIEPKIYSLNLSEEVEDISMNKLRNINNRIYSFIINSSIKLYKESYWLGLNDRVLKRYR